MQRWFLPLVWTLCASVALAEPPAPSSGARSPAASLVQQQLIGPLARAESRRSRFSRAAPVVLQRRVRVLDEVARSDARGRQFVRFAVDVRRPSAESSGWQKDALVGCAYPAERLVFVRRGDEYFQAASVLGEDGDAEPGACVAAQGQEGGLASAAR